VTDYSEAGLASGAATGFRFERYAADALRDAVDRALAVYAQGEKWRQLMRNGMAQDWSWRRSGREYVEVYRKACRKVLQGAPG
jgi:starch synthase